LSNIHIKFCQIDNMSGAIYLQFATDDTLHMISEQAMHAFFPSQYESDDIEKLLPEIARFGQQMLNYQKEAHKNQFSPKQMEEYQKYLGNMRSVALDDNTELEVAGLFTSASDKQYVIDATNTNKNVDYMRNVVLEVLAEEGLIPGRVK
jgi:hypothetical protein